MVQLSKVLSWLATYKLSWIRLHGLLNVVSATPKLSKTSESTENVHTISQTGIALKSKAWPT